MCLCLCLSPKAKSTLSRWGGGRVGSGQCGWVGLCLSLRRSPHSPGEGEGWEWSVWVGGSVSVAKAKSTLSRGGRLGGRGGLGMVSVGGWVCVCRQRRCAHFPGEGGWGGGEGWEWSVWVGECVSVCVCVAKGEVHAFQPPRWPSGKASASRADGPGFESRLARDFFFFFEVESYL